MCEFEKSDVIIIAKAVMEDPLEYISNDHYEELYCTFCDAILRCICPQREDFVHEINCPVNIAQDILTNNEE